MFSLSFITFMLWGTGSFIIIILGVIVVLLKKSKGKKKSSEPKEKVDKATKNKRYDSLFQLRLSFVEALAFLKSRVSGRNYIYKTPWFLMLGESRNGKSTILANTGLGTPLGNLKAEQSGQKKGVQWWFYDYGVMIEPKGEFVLKQDGMTSNKNGWGNIIKLLKKFRPHRPIDGVILTIPCEDIIPGENITDQNDRIADKANNLYEKLRELQREFGTCFPVYILLTKCDQIIGFKSFCNELPEKQKSSIFGWSTPYSLDSKYSPDWVDEAVEKLSGDIFNTQMELFAAKSDVEQADDLYLFMENFRAVRDTLRIYVNTIFKESAYHNSFYFRGLFFTGDGEKSGGEIKPVFLKDFLQKKVFPEGGLAKMVDKVLLSKHRTLRKIQLASAVLLLIGVAGLTNSYFNLREENQVMIPVLNQINDSLVELKYKKTVDRTLFEKKALKLLNGMTHMEPSNLNSIFIPWSWNAEIKTRIWSSITIAYERIIMRMMYIELNNRAQSISLMDRKYSAEEGETYSNATALEELPSFKKLYRYVRNLEDLEKNITIYNEKLVRGMANAREFGQVVKFLYGIDLKDNFSQDALTKLQGTHIATHILKANTKAKIWKLTFDFYNEAFKNNYLKKKLLTLEGKLKTIRKDESGTGENIVIKIQDVLNLLNDLEVNLSEPQFAWIGNTKFNLGDKFTQVLKSIRNSGFLGEQIHNEIVKRGEYEFRRLQRQLKEVKPVLTGPVLSQEDDKVVLKFSPGVVTLTKSLKDYFSMKFAAIENENAKISFEIPKGRRLVWNGLHLQQAIKLYESYNQFVTERLIEFPRDLQAVFQQVAKESLETNMIDMISRAYQFEFAPDELNVSLQKEALRSEVMNFKEVSNYLVKILEIFDRLKLHKTNQKLFRLVATQGNKTLKIVDQMLLEEDLYMMGQNGFQRWNGYNNPVFSAYNVSDKEELQFYFSVQRKRAAFLAQEYAVPLVSFLGYRNKFRGYVDIPLVTKWERIINDINQYEKKVPGNSIDTLENFIAMRVDEISKKQCNKEIPQRVLSAHSKDYFLQQKNRIAKKIFQRCQALSIERDFREF